MPAASPAKAAPDRPRRRLAEVAAVASICGLALVAYWGTWNGSYVYDDLSAIRDNQVLQSGNWWDAALGPARSPLSNRPVACLSLVLDRTLFGAAIGNRAVALALHLLVAAMAFLTVRAALRAENFAARLAPARSHTIAVVAATLWAVHPLTVDAVAYATQRSVLLMGGFALTTLYLLLRGERSPQRRTIWQAGALVSLALAMGSKEEIVAAPLLLPLFWRAFVAPDWRATMARWPLFAAMASSWAVLAYCVAKGPYNPTVGYATTPAATAIDWLQTQAGVVVHYLVSTIWPLSLRGCYDWPIVRELGPAILPGLVVVLLLATTVLAWRRAPALGFAGAFVFLLLAPTSSIMPIVTELAAERRMYLPLLAVMVLTAVVIERLASRAGRLRLDLVVLAGLCAALIPLTRARVAAYRDEPSFWTDAYARHDPQNLNYVSAILIDNYARVVRERGDLATALQLFARAASVEHAPQTLRLHHATALIENGDLGAADAVLGPLGKEVPHIATELNKVAESKLNDWLRRHPDGKGDSKDQFLIDTLALARAAVGMQPRTMRFHATYGSVLGAMGRIVDAESTFRQAVALAPDDIAPRTMLSDHLLRLQRRFEAEQLWTELLARRPKDLSLRLRLGQDFLARNELDLARTMFAAALELQPDNAAAKQGMARVGAPR